MPLVSTGAAARALGLSTKTLQRWAADGWVSPEYVTRGGHMRWDVDKLRQQIRDQRRTDQ
ncbi:MAG TPA: MerR family transcriptional regulator [Streptomyces sp.]